MERPILRSELRSASSTPPPSSDDEALQRLRNFQTFNYAVQDAPMSDAAPETTAQDEDEDEELAFNLFAPTASSTTNAKPSNPAATTPARKIRLRSPSLDTADAGFVQPARDQSYYFTGPVDSKTKSAFQPSALTPSQLIRLSHTPWPGSRFPWKTIHLPSSSHSRAHYSALTQHACPQLSHPNPPPRKHRRLGKKARIATRQKLRVEAAKRAQAMESHEAREAAEREKRARRNREKKVKRKARDKAKKAGGEGEVAAEGEGSGGD